METQKTQSKTQKPKEILLRMSNNHFRIIKSESQRMNVSVTALMNVIIDNYVKSLKINENGE